MNRIVFSFYALIILSGLFSYTQLPQRTTVSIDGEQFLINDELTYKDRIWNGHKIEGLLMNARLVQGIFDDLNPETRERFQYPDTKKWDPERNTNEFIAAMPSWKEHGMLAFTLNLQGGSPLGYGNHGWINSAFQPDGSLRKDYMLRLERILDAADQIGMVVILGYFYGGQDQVLTDESAVVAAVENITLWILEKGYQNILIEVNNEADYPNYDHEILKTHRIHELVAYVQELSEGKLLVSTSYRGGALPGKNVLEIADFILIHGNKVEDPARITEMVQQVREMPEYTEKPILFNEDDHFDFDKEENNFVNAVKEYASWGYFDFRKENESFENGFQSVPIDWRISSPRKKEFFNKLKEITLP